MALFEIKTSATGEVRDAEGNLLNTFPIEKTVVVDEATALELMKELNPEVKP